MTVHSLSDAKTQAKALRSALAAQGTDISHAQALELVAKQMGARDWNTLHAKLARQEPQPLKLGDKVRGRYLGQDFTAQIVALSKQGRSFKVSLQLDEAIDTVRSEGFSNLRRHIRGVVGADGTSMRKTSDGAPHLVIDLSPGASL